MRRLAVGIIAAGITLALPAVAGATTSPNGPGQPGAPQTTCGSPNTNQTPGAAASAAGSPFNPTGTAGGVYAGNPGTASLANSASGNAVSQYDIACFQVFQNH